MRLTLSFLAALICSLMAMTALSNVNAQGRLPPAPEAQPVAPPPQVTVSPGAAEAYRNSYTLGIGDQLRVIVYGESDLSGVYQIDANGAISLPLIGTIQASGRTIQGLEQYIAEQYNQYLRDPKVNLQITQYRPFFILGEVKQPGSYPFIPGMTTKNAVALAGGYTVRGGPGGLSIEQPGGKEHDAGEDTTVAPGDTIRVGSRLF
jgi:protein involved in polysaccharide export with SLBB domain